MLNVDTLCLGWDHTRAVWLEEQGIQGLTSGDNYKTFLPAGGFSESCKVFVWGNFSVSNVYKISDCFIWNSAMTKSNLKRYLVIFHSILYYTCLYQSNFHFFLCPKLFIIGCLHGLSHKIISLWKKHPSIYCVYFLWGLWIYLTILHFFPFTTLELLLPVSFGTGQSWQISNFFFLFETCRFFLLQW